MHLGAMQHSGPIAAVAAHGHYLASAGYDNRVIVWDTRSRRGVARAWHDHLVNHCAFSHDGRLLVTASSDYSARVWELPELRLRCVLTGHSDDVDMAAFSPDGTRIATCALDRCVRIFSLEGQCLQRMPGHTGNVLSLAWSPDGNSVVTSSVDGTLRRWDAHSGAALACSVLDVRSDSVEIAPDGSVYAGDDRGRLAVLRAGSLQFVQAHQAGIKKIALAQDARTLVSLSYDRSIAVWRLSETALPELLERSALPADVWARAATVLADGRIATGTFGGSYALFDPAANTWDLQDVAAGPAINAVLHHGGACYSVGDAGQVLRDGKAHARMGSLCNFLVGSADALLTGGQLGQLFDAHTGVVLYQHHAPLNCATTFTRDGVDCVAVGSYTGEVLVFSRDATGHWNLLQSLAVYENAVKGLSYCDGLLFSVCASTDIAWHRVSDWHLTRRVPAAHARIANACCSLGAQRFATVSRDRSLRIWDGDSVQTYPSAHPNSIKCMAVDTRRSAVLTGSYGGTLALFDLTQRRWSALTRPSSCGISSISWDEAGERFIAASYDGELHPVAL